MCPANSLALRHRHAAFAGRQMLDRVKRETGDIAQGAGLAALVGGAGRMAGIGNDGDATAFGQFPQGIIVGRLPAVVYRHDSLCAGGNLSGPQIWDRSGEVSASMSANTGVAPSYRAALALAAKVMAGTMTSSPGPRFSARMAQCRAAVPELTATPSCGATEPGKGLLEARYPRARRQPIGRKGLQRTA